MEEVELQLERIQSEEEAVSQQWAQARSSFGVVLREFPRPWRL